MKDHDSSKIGDLLPFMLLGHGEWKRIKQADSLLLIPGRDSWILDLAGLFM